MTVQQCMAEFTNWLCKGRRIVVDSFSSLILFYQMPMNTKTLYLIAYEEYDFEKLIKEFSKNHDYPYQIVKDTPAAYHIYLKQDLLVMIRLSYETYIDPYQVTSKDDIYFKRVNTVFANLLALYSYTMREEAYSSILWILKNKLDEIEDNNIYYARTYAMQKGWKKLIAALPEQVNE